MSAESNRFWASKRGQGRLRRAVFKRREQDARAFPVLTEHKRLERLRAYADRHGIEHLSPEDRAKLGR